VLLLALLAGTTLGVLAPKPAAPINSGASDSAFGDAAPVASIDRQVSDPSDDAYAYESGIMNCTDNRNFVLDGQMFAGHDPWGWCHSKTGLRFREIPLASGYVIQSAYLEVYCRKSQLGDSPKLKIRAQYGDAEAFSTRIDYDGRRKTAGVAWAPDVGDWSAWAWRRTSDIKGVIQEVLDEGSFSYGDDLALFIEDDLSTPRNEIEVGPNARLHVEWIPPPDTATPTNTPTHAPTATTTPTRTATPSPVATPTPCVLPDADRDGVCDGSDNCPAVYNPGQENSDDRIGNGAGLPGDDATVPNGDSFGDACDDDSDNDGIPNASDPDLGGDVTYDDNNNGIMCSTDAADDGPSWDHDCNGKRDGAEGTCTTSTADADGDGLLDKWEECKWGTSANSTDSDGDGLADCEEAADVDGNGNLNFTGDVISYAQAILLPPASFGQDGDFDIDGNSNLDFTGDVIQEAKFAFVDGLCK